MSQYADLDILCSPDKEIMLDKKMYKIPGDLSTKMAIELLNISQKFANVENEASNINDIGNTYKQFIDVIYKILKIKHPDLEYDYFDSIMTIKKAVAFYNFVQNNITPQDTLKMIDEKVEELSGKKK